jgi:hypothetical protein
MDIPPGPEAPPPGDLRFLRRLVLALTAVMIGGIVAIVALLVIRLGGAGAAGQAMPELPAGIALPEGAEARAVTFGTGWVAVVTSDDRILVFDARDGRLRQELRIAP